MIICRLSGAIHHLPRQFQPRAIARRRAGGTTRLSGFETLLGSRAVEFAVTHKTTHRIKRHAGDCHVA
jgi:hypothetical protein